jgi:hypothetical protein
MRNRIPEVTEAAVIEDFYRGSNDSAFVRAILQKHQQHHDATRTSSPTNAGRRDLAKKYTPLDYQPLAPGEDLAEASARWTTSSTPSARKTRTCATLFGTAGTSSIPSGTADPSNLYLLLRRGEDQKNHDNPVAGGGRGRSFPAC